MRRALSLLVGTTGLAALAVMAGLLAFAESADAAKPVCGDNKCQGNEAKTCPDDCGGDQPDGGGDKDIPVCITLNDLTPPTVGETSDVLGDGIGDGDYCHSNKNKIRAVVGRNRHVFLGVGGASGRALDLNLAFPELCICSTDVDLDGDDFCDGWANTMCDNTPPDLGIFPNLSEAKFIMAGEDLDDLPLGCTHEDNAVLKFTDGVDDWVLQWGPYDHSSGASHCPGSDPITVERLSNDVWTFATAGAHLACLYRQENPPHRATEYHGQFAVKFSGFALAKENQAAPTVACPAQGARDRRGRTIGPDSCPTQAEELGGVCPVP